MKSYGKCPVCQRWIRITSLEKLFKHSPKPKKMWPPADCKGWGREPLEIRMVPSVEQEKYLESLIKGPHVHRKRPQRKESQ